MKSQIFKVSTTRGKNGPSKRAEIRVKSLTLTARPDPKTGVCDFRHVRLLEALAGAFSNSDGFEQLTIKNDYQVETKRAY